MNFNIESRSKALRDRRRGNCRAPSRFVAECHARCRSREYSPTLRWQTQKVGKYLGFDIERGIPQRIGSVRGSFLAYGHEAPLIVLDIEIIATVYFAAEENFPINVLGRVGWLNRVRLGLVDYESRLYLSDYNDPA